MKIWKLVSGILSIVMFIIITIQSCATGVVNVLENNKHDTSDSAGVFVAFLLLVAGIVSVSVWKLKHKGGDIALIVLYCIAALYGFSNLGTFTDLVVWSSWALICAILPAISLAIKAYQAVPTVPVHNLQQSVGYERSRDADNSIHCPYCNAVVSQEDIFCEQCGKKLPREKVCSNCGNKLTENDRFCPNCGKSLLTEKPVDTEMPKAPIESLQEQTTIGTKMEEQAIKVDRTLAQRNNTIWIASSIIAGSLIIAGFIFFLFYGKDFDLFKNKEKEEINDPTTEVSGETQYKSVLITGQDLRLRKGPSTNEETLQYEDGANVHPKQGDNLEYMGEANNFYKVRYKGNIVYVSKDFSTLSQSEPHIKEPTVVVISGDNVVMRMGPSTNDRIVQTYNGRNIMLKKWNTYKYVGSEGDFYKINYNNSYYYVSKYYSHPD